MTGYRFDLETFKKYAGASSRPRDRRAAFETRHRADITEVYLSDKWANITIRESGKQRGVQLSLTLTHSALLKLLEGIHAEHSVKLEEANNARSKAEARVQVTESALVRLASNALTLKRRAKLPTEDLPPLFSLDYS